MRNSEPRADSPGRPDTRILEQLGPTGWGQDEDRQKSRDAGFDDHIVKPVEIEALTNLLAQCG